jgi:phosphoserine phosphatase RsbU/P
LKFSSLNRIGFKRSDLKKNLKLQAFLGFAVLLFILHLIFTPSASILLRIFTEIITGLTVISLVVYLAELMKLKTVNPLSLVMNVGILNAIIFFIITFSDSILMGFFDNVGDSLQRPGLAVSIISFLYIFLMLGATTYIFLAFKEFYFLKQNKKTDTYFTTMIVFFLLYSAAGLLNDFESLSYIKNTFFIISIFLIIINSIKISWIAFIVKREKISLLILSAVISVLFIVNAVNMIGSAHHNVMINFSPALEHFMTIIMIYGAVYFGVLFFTTLFHIPTAEAFDRKAQEVSSLQYFSKLINQVLDFSELAETVTEIAAKVCRADASWIVIKKNNSYEIISNKNIGFLNADTLTKTIFEFYGEESFASTSIISMHRFKDKLALIEEKYSSLAVSPLKAHNELRGFLVAAKKDNFVFDEEDKEAINTFADYASVAIENSRLLEESIEKERLEKELDVAREIQRKILPAKNPEYKNLNISSIFIPAFEVGGDYYDFFEISDKKLGFIIADVSGKGISAAFVMAEIKGIFESLAREIESPKKILKKANDILRKSLDRKTFVSAAYGIIDTEKETLTLSRAGHCPVIMLRQNEAQNIRPSGIGLGLSFGERFESTLEEVTISLQENDMVVLYTDGITEAKNLEMDDFGEDLFEKILLENIDKETDEIANKVIREVMSFSQHTSQHDDITLVILKWKQKINLDGEKEWQNSAPQLQIKMK